MTFRSFFVCIVALASCSITFGQDSYRCLDDGLSLDLIHSDPEAFYISMDMDPRGNLYVGGRDAVYLFEADGDGGFKARRTITTLPKHTWAYSLQVAGDDLYVLTVTALYRLPNVIRDPDNVTFERLVWGIPLGHIHQGLHGMKMGPDGGLYLAFGDPQPGPFRRKTNPGHVWHWTFLSGPDARKTPWTGVGGVVRYDPNSHELKTISRGFRNICDLDFDEHWNLFGNDNDQEGSALHSFGRLTHVTEGSHYQWSRGWLQAKEPYRNDLIRTIDPAIGRFVPFGTCYYNEDHLGDAYKRSLVVARWGSRELGQFPLRGRGASFASSQKPLLVGKGTARPVAVFTGNDGRLFASICFMERNEASPVKQTDLVVISNPKKPLELHAIDPSTADISAFLDEIETSSWKRRFNAHREIISRGMSGNEQVRERFLKATAGSPAWYSLAWLAGRNDDGRVVAALTHSVSSSNGQVAGTSAGVLRRFHQLSESQIESLLTHESPVAQLAGLRAADGAELHESINKLATSSDSLVRQAAQRWIGQHTSWQELEEDFNDGDLPTRRTTMAAAMWKWNDSVESGTIPDGVKISAAAKKHLNGFHYVDDSESNLETESAKHGFKVGGLPMMDWWKQTAVANPDVPEIGVISRMINLAIYDSDDSHRKTAAVFANTLGMDDLAARIPGLAQTRKIQADIAKGAKLSASMSMPPEYEAVDWTTAWRKGNAKTGAALFKKKCIACHDPGFGGGVIGPSLAGVAKRFTPPYLAQSVAAPSKAVSPNFQTWSIIQDNGKVLLGFLAGEDENRVTLQMMDGSLKAVEKSSIEEKLPSKTSLMPVGLITGPEDLKHIVRYLMTLKTSGISATEGFIDLLAGGDLKEHFETTGNWSLGEDSVAELRPREGETDWKRYGDYLWLKNEYQDFQCEFEYKHGTGGNGGLYFNVTDRQQAVGSVIEVQIRDSADEKELDAHAVTGGILPEVAPRANATKPAGEWNHMSVTSVSGNVTVRLNGVMVNNVKLTHHRLANKPKQGFIGFQDHGLPFWLRNVRIRSLESSAERSEPMALATGVPGTNGERPRPAAIAAGSQDPLIVNVVGAINPNAANSFLFVPTEAKYVRVDVLESSIGQPCIDEVEVFSGDSPKNFALHSNGAKATASSLLKGFEEKHQIEFLNDGKYGNGHSWIPAKMPGWAQIELPEAMTIDRVVLSRDRGGKLARRVPVSFDILVSGDGKEWSTVKKVRPAAAKKDAPRKPVPDKNDAKRKARRAAAAMSKISKAGTVPNILWVTVEDMSPTLGCYGDTFARTPNLDAFAKESVLYTNAFAVSPVCSPSRSTLITGMYNASMGTNQMRSSNHIPTGVRGFPSLLRKAGYYTSNNVKTDYNCAENKRLIKESWDLSSAAAHWKDRESGQPFFSVFNDMTTHQSRTMVWPYPAFQEHVQSRLSKQQISDPAAVPLPPYYPDTPVVRKTMARFYDCVSVMDQNVKRILDQLEEDGLADDTIVFFYSDHGSGMPRHKRLLLDSGMRVALMVRFPGKYQHLAPAAAGSRLDRLVSFVDFPSTVLNLTGQPIPDYMQGIPFLGPGSETERETVYGTRDRVDEVIETARSVRDKQFLYVRNYMPHLSYNQPSVFSDLGEIRQDINRAAKTNLAALTVAQRAYAGPSKPVEEFYDCIADPDNIVNLLAGELSPDQQAALERLRETYAKTRREIRDVGALPESVMHDQVREEGAPIRDILVGKTSHAPDLDAAWAAADLVGTKNRDLLVTALASPNAADRYWALVGMRVDFADDPSLHDLAEGHLTDMAADVRIEAASWLAESSKQYRDRALQSLIGDTALDDWWSALRACRAIELLGPKAESLLPRMKELYTQHRNQSGDQSFFLAFSSGAFLEQFGAKTIPWDFTPGAGGFSADPDKKKAAADETGFTPIFNGTNLDEWDHRKGAWEVADGAISCTGKEKTRNWIIWRGGTPSDFVLRLDFKYEAGNSGVQVRSDDQGDHQVYGYQVEVAAQKVMGLWHHSLLARDDPAREARHLMATAGQEVAISTDGGKSVRQVATKEAIVAHYRQEDWNTMEIIAEGNTLTQKINGVVFSEVADDDKRMSRRKGVIALQDHGKGCQVAFKNIRIKELSREGK
jgi:putative heme-binding domain-containing protein